MYKRIVLFIILTSPAFATTTTSDQLENLNQSIATVQNKITQSTAQKTQLRDALAKIETRESALRQQIQATQNQLTAQQKQLQILQTQYKPLMQERIDNHRQLSKEVQAAYIFDNRPFSKILLTPGNVQQTGQILMYYHYITQAQMQSMKQLEQSINAFSLNQTAIQNQYTKLLALKKTQLQNQQDLQQTVSDRKSLLASVNNTIETNQQKLSQLLHNREQLQSTIATLNTESAKPSENFISHVSFSRLQGKLPWPLHGTIHNLFGTSVNGSELTWDGTLIDAPEGTPIRAVADGRVIFAKWMPGYGLLMIINHGNGYMTLYGRNQALMKNTGDAVSAGDVIATTGQSGGFDTSALYFEIRHDAKPLNPGDWCRF